MLQQLSEDVGRIAAILASLSEEEAPAAEAMRAVETQARKSRASTPPISAR